MRIVIFDLETRLHASQLSPDRDYGWMRLRNGDGGISAICVYDLSEDWLYMYDDNPLSLKAAVAHLEGADVVIGYNTLRFDIPCIEGVWGRRLKLREHIDLYTLIARTNAQKGIVGKRGEFKLDRVCRRAFGRGKSGSGAHAPDLVKDGRFAELFLYCAHDVRLTRDLFIHICKTGSVMNNTGSLLRLEIPQWIRNAVLDATRNGH